MEQWQRDFDRWLTNPPEPKEIPAGNCEECGDVLIAGYSGYRDARLDLNYCSRECFRKALLRCIDDEIDYFIELLEDNGDAEDDYVIEGG